MKKLLLFSFIILFVNNLFAQFSQFQKLYPTNDSAGAEFGNYVLIKGTDLFIGAYYSDYEASNGGTVYYYTYEGNQWNMTQQITTNGEIMADDHFGSALASYGNWLMISANADDTNGYYEVGSVYFYQLIDNQWVERQKISYPGLNDDDNFGWSIDIYDTIAVIGAPGYFSNKGAVFIYTYDGNQWQYRTILQSDDIAFDDNFGYSVSFDGHYLLVGAPGKNSSAGAAYIFEYSNGQWTQMQKIVASDGSDNANFACSVAIRDTIVVVGAYGRNNNQGAVYVFEKQSNSWAQNAILTANDGADDNYLGQSLSFDGNKIIAGAWAANNMQGAAYIFEKNNGQWAQSQKLTASDGGYNDRFGISVDISGGIALVGAHYDSSNGLYSGSAYVFTTPPPSIDIQPQSAQVCIGDTAVFSILANNASDYQWFKDGTALTDNSHYLGSTTSILHICDVVEADTGEYWCQVSNPIGTEVSSHASLGVDNPIEAQATDIITCDSLITLTGNDPSPGVGYWTVLQGNIKIENSQLPNSQAIAYPDTSILRWTIINGSCETYSDITVVNKSVVITLQPKDIQAEVGDTVLFNVSIIGKAAGYQWYKDGNSIDGAFDSVLVILNVNENDVGSYFCAITPFENCPVVNSNIAHLTITNSYVSIFPKVNLYPNPTQGNVMLINNTGKMLYIRLWNLNGKILFQKNIGKTNEITLPEPGVYLLQVGDDVSTKTIKIIRQ